jgi:predicted secreted protein
MQTLTFVAIYFVTWWLCLFFVLPFGVKTQQEDEGGTVLGTTESAPARPMLLRKALITTALAGVVVGALYFANARFNLNIEAISRWFD